MDHELRLTVNKKKQRDMSKARAELQKEIERSNYRDKGQRYKK